MSATSPAIVVLDGHTLNPGDNPWDPVAALGTLTVHDRTDPADVLARAAGAEILLTNKTLLPAEILDRLPSLRFIAVLATGYNVVDLDAARRRGIAVANVPTYGTDSVAEYTFALILALSRRAEHHAEAVARGEWTASPDFSFWLTPQVELRGKTLAIVGLGRIGRRVAEIAHAFGMRILAVDVHHAPDLPVPGARWAGVEEAFAEADFVTLHCPLTDSNAGFVNRRLLARMKHSAFLINTARGPLVDETDLAQALRDGLLAGAACDVIASEPMQRDHPFLGIPNLIVTPHIAWATLEARRRLMATTADNVRAFLAGSPINVVNGPVAPLKA